MLGIWQQCPSWKCNQTNGGKYGGSWKRKICSRGGQIVNSYKPRHNGDCLTIPSIATLMKAITAIPTALPYLPPLRARSSSSVYCPLMDSIISLPLGLHCQCWWLWWIAMRALSHDFIPNIWRSASKASYHTSIFSVHIWSIDDRYHFVITGDSCSDGTAMY